MAWAGPAEAACFATLCTCWEVVGNQRKSWFVKHPRGYAYDQVYSFGVGVGESSFTHIIGGKETILFATTGLYGQWSFFFYTPHLCDSVYERCCY